jgi:CP family cyanate transporter-like MFS transporter
MQPGQFVTVALLLWLLGAALRVTVLAVPPLIPVIQADLHLSGTEVGLLAGLPVILFAVAALPGSILIARLGALRTLLFGLLLTAAGGSLRGLAATAAALDAATIAMAAGVAVMQPAMAAIVREWLPLRIGFGTALYTFGLIVGEIAPVALTIPLVLPLLHDSWRLGLAAWSLPVLAIAILTAVLAPARQRHARCRRKMVARLERSIGLAPRLHLRQHQQRLFRHQHLSARASERCRPFRSDQQRIDGPQFRPAPGLGADGRGRASHRTPCLALCGRRLLDFAGLVRRGLERRSVDAVLGRGAGPVFRHRPSARPGAAAATGGAAGDLARTSAAMFTISYALAMAISIAGGAAWDFTGHPAFAFLPIGLVVLPLVLLTPTVGFHRN